MYEVSMPGSSTHGLVLKKSTYDKTEAPAKDGISEMMMVK
jgi:hypothetical protein